MTSPDFDAFHKALLERARNDYHDFMTLYANDDPPAASVMQFVTARFTRTVQENWRDAAVELKQLVIEWFRQLPKPIDYPGLRERISVNDSRHPLNFGKQGWSWPVAVTLPLVSGARELKVEPRHRHHHWAAWAYEKHED